MIAAYESEVKRPSGKLPFPGLPDSMTPYAVRSFCALGLIVGLICGLALPSIVLCYFLAAAVGEFGLCAYKIGVTIRQMRAVGALSGLCQVDGCGREATDRISYGIAGGTLVILQACPDHSENIFHAAATAVAKIKLEQPF